MKVKDILGNKAARLITIKPEHTVLEASQLLAEHNIGAVVVVDKNDTPVGILSERDIVRQVASDKSDALNRKVSEIMTKDVIIGFLDDELSSVSSTMTEKRIRHLPIMENKELVGMVSIGDIVKAQLDHFANEAHMLRQYITGG